MVLATANSTRLKRDLKEGYKSHELYETIVFELDSKIYEGIVLDVCGSCFYTEGETLQRYDIFTIGSVIGKKKGLIYE